MNTIEQGSLVILHCMNPKEKLWGELIKLDQVGAVIRGLELYSVEDWLRQLKDTETVGYVSPSTVFVPIHRVERIYLDETTEAAECYADRYRALCGGDVLEALRCRPGQRR